MERSSRDTRAKRGNICAVVLRFIIAFGSVLLAGTGVSRGRAQPAQPGAVVAVLPVSTPSGRMAIYAKPVADAIAKRLRSAVRTTRVKVESLSTSGPVPTRVDLVVYGRLVARSGNQVVLEARVHDPERGRKWRMVATDARALTDIDQLAAALGEKLAPDLDRAIAEQRNRRAAEARARRRRAAEARVKKAVHLPATVIRGQGAATPPRAVDKRPRMVVLRAGARYVSDPGLVGDVVTHNAGALAERLGYRTVGSSERGVVPAAVARAEIARTGARLALMIDVQRIRFKDHGKVMSARGLVRVVLADASGQVLYDRTAKTGTLVGSRGDRHAALIHLVAEQVVDIVAPRAKRALEVRSP